MSVQVAILVLGIIMQVGGTIFLMNEREEKQRNIAIYVTAFGFILLVTIGMIWIALAILAIRFAYSLYQSKQK